MAHLPPLFVRAAAFAALLGFGGAQGAAAADLAARAMPPVGPAYADPAVEPNSPAACAPHSADFSVPGLWLGHFTGGRFTRLNGAPPALEWKDLYSCFPTAASCLRWQRDNLHAFHGLQGYRTCLPLRGGGRHVLAARHVVIAKY
ncbi:hypothetical protein [Acidiphilium sp.]|uniref:hypothetical protein n=1 Tax=Acidiphilium sp. TaxID=527 RepID=UPI002C5FF4AC|nr:hypothetical protein [Acidiphilium sp.]HQT62836.1 hypothetical protein [Acidiphilium sp.]